MFDKIIKISLLGEFSMECDNVKITKENLSPQMCSFIAFLAVNKNKKISLDMIIEYLWQKEVTNPSSSIKNLVYRTKKALENLQFPYAKDLFISNTLSYSLNTEFQFNIDTEIFENLCTKKDFNNKDEQLENYSEILNIYKGKFLSDICSIEWVIPYSTQMQTYFLNSMYSYLELLRKDEKYEKIIEVASKITHIDNYDEQIHKYILFSLYKNGQITRALDYYSYITNIFANELGIELSENTTAIYRQICETSKVIECDIVSLQKELIDNDFSTPLYCGFEIFKQVYRFLVRSNQRASVSIFLMLLTISYDDINTKENYKISTAKRLKQTILSSLRKGDVCSSPSPNQFIIILPYCDYENCEKISMRIKRNFKNDFHSQKVKINHSIKLIDTIL